MSERLTECVCEGSGVVAMACVCETGKRLTASLEETRKDSSPSIPWAELRRKYNVRDKVSPFDQLATIKALMIERVCLVDHGKDRCGKAVEAAEKAEREGMNSKEVEEEALYDWAQCALATEILEIIDI